MTKEQLQTQLAGVDQEVKTTLLTAYEDDLATPYELNQAPMGCLNFLVGQYVFKNMFEMVMLATKSSKMQASVAMSSFFLEGGLRWKALKDGVRVPYHSPCGIVRGSTSFLAAASTLSSSSS